MLPSTNSLTDPLQTNCFNWKISRISLSIGQSLCLLSAATCNPKYIISIWRPSLHKLHHLTDAKSWPELTANSFIPMASDYAAHTARTVPWVARPRETPEFLRIRPSNIDLELIENTRALPLHFSKHFKFKTRGLGPFIGIENFII
jgi:hypothetical protein